jgi:2-(1,2-epoxy-1,2-dihydrophenyl)acetyl-CoA isomerase
MSDEMGLVELERDGAVGIVRLHHPPVNAVNGDVLRAFEGILDEARDDDALRAIVLVGEGRGFCGGGDTSVMGDTALVDRRDTLELAARVVERLLRMPKPIIAAVHGFAAGAGLSLAFGCDLTIAEVSTRFRLAFGSLAIIPDLGAHFFLVEALGVRRATELIWSDADFTATQAFEWGLLNAVVPAGEAFPETMRRATALAAGPRRAIEYTKAIITGSRLEHLRRTMAEEALASTLLRSTPDHAEGLEAFRERRAPMFGGG